MSRFSDDEFALITGICLGALMKFNPRDDDLIRLVLSQPGVKSIAYAAPNRMLADIYATMKMSYEDPSSSSVE